MGLKHRLKRLLCGSPPSEWRIVDRWPAGANDQWNRLDRRDYLARSIRGLVAGLSEGPPGIPYERSTTERTDLHSHNRHVTLATVLARAAAYEHPFTWFDWGCSAGYALAVARRLLPELRFDFTGYDFEQPCEAANGEFRGDNARFVTDMADVTGPFTLVTAIASLHYADNWRREVESLANRSSRFLFITRLPIVETEAPLIVEQDLRIYGIDASVVSRCLSRREFIGAVEEHGFGLVQEFLSEEDLTIPPGDMPVTRRGYLFRRL